MASCCKFLASFAYLYSSTMACVLGLASEARMQAVAQKQAYIQQAMESIKAHTIAPKEINTALQQHNMPLLKEPQTVYQLLQRPELTMSTLMALYPGLVDVLCATNLIPPAYVEQVEILAKYEVYIQKEQELVEKFQKLENMLIPPDVDFEKMVALSTEAREKLKKLQPNTIGQASKISGVSPSDIAILMVFLGR